MPLAAGMDDTSIEASKGMVRATKCNLVVKAKWGTGEKIEFEICDLDPNTVTELIPWLRERRIESKEPEK